MPAEAAPRVAPRVLQWAGWLFGLLALLAVVAVAAHLGDIERIAELLRSLSPVWLLLALLLQAATYFSLALAWQNGLHHAGIERSVRKLLPLTLAKLFVDQAAPTGGISGTAFLVAALVRRGIAAPACLAVLLANLVGHYGANLLAALVAIGLLWQAHETRTWMVGVFALFALVSVAIPTGMLALRRYGREAPSWLLRIPGLAPLLRAANDAPMTLLRRPRVLATMTALSVAVILLDAGTLWVMLNALGLPTPYQVAFPSYLLDDGDNRGPDTVGIGNFRGDLRHRAGAPGSTNRRRADRNAPASGLHHLVAAAPRTHHGQAGARFGARCAAWTGRFVLVLPTLVAGFRCVTASRSGECRNASSRL